MRKKKCRWVTYLAAGLLAGLLGLWNTGNASAQVEEPRPLKVAFSITGDGIKSMMAIR